MIIFADYRRTTGFLQSLIRRWTLSLTILLATASDARATFHFMQIEQVVAGVNGDYSAQAVQLRMRSAGQEQVQLTRLVAWNANGENPIVLLDLDHPVTVSETGARILAVTAAFPAYTQPFAEPDFVLIHPIPPSYVTAGTLTFETDDGSFVVWRLAWGGGHYHGTTRGGQTNDDDGDFGPPWDGPLPGEGLSSLQTSLAADATGTGSAHDFRMAPPPAVFVNNAGQAFELAAFACADAGAGADTDTDGDGIGDACDRCPEDRDKEHPGRCGCGVSDADADGDGLPDCAALPPPVEGDGAEDPADPEDGGMTDDGHDHNHGDSTSGDVGGADDEQDPEHAGSGTIGQVTYGAFCGTVSLWMWGLMTVTLLVERRRTRRGHAGSQPPRSVVGVARSCRRC